jgi:hypothetical protein
MWKSVSIIVATGAVLAGCGAPALDPGPAPQATAQEAPALVGNPPTASAWDPPLDQPASAAIGGADGVGFTCWDAYGNPLPQDSPTCAPGWGGRPPEHPLPIDDLGSGGIVP